MYTKGTQDGLYAIALPIDVSIHSTSIRTQPCISRPYTLYNITLQTSSATAVVQKRYSDFLALRNSLYSMVGTWPLGSLPRKHWLRSTVRSPELTESRRKALEYYLRTLAETPDRRGREAPAWRQFMQLPRVEQASTSLGSADKGASVCTLNQSMVDVSKNEPHTWSDPHTGVGGNVHDGQLRTPRLHRVTYCSTTIEAFTAMKKTIVEAGGLPITISIGVPGFGMPDSDPSDGSIYQRLVSQRRTMPNEDESPDLLRGIVRRQRAMAAQINREIDDTMDIIAPLNDDDDVRLRAKMNIAKKRVQK
ncbi:PX domain-containing protein [Seiridium cupressi]